MNQPQNRINLDWIRGLAALLVCALHCREITWIGLREYASDLSSHGPVDIALAFMGAPIVWGSIGVTVFFVLSGYVIHASSARRLLDNPGFKLDTWRFYERRLIRIYPVLLGALALTYALDSITVLADPTHNKLGTISLSTLVGTMLALNGTLVSSFGSDGPLWTLAIEIQFYALYPLLLIARRRFSAETLLAASAVLSIASYAFVQPARMELFSSYYFFWILGFYAAELHARGRLDQPRAPTGAAALVTTIAGCGVFFVSQYYGQVLWAIGFFLFLMNLLARPPKEGVIIRALSAVGLFSYTLYATHFPIVVFLHATTIDGAKTSSMTVVLMFTAATILISYPVFLLFERPSLLWLAGRQTTKRSGGDAQPG